MDKSFKGKLESVVKKQKEGMDEIEKQNPFGVPISTGGWAAVDGSSVYRGLNYIYGCHPGSSYIFLVNAVDQLLNEPSN